MPFHNVIGWTMMLSVCIMLTDHGLNWQDASVPVEQPDSRETPTIHTTLEADHEDVPDTSSFLDLADIAAYAGSRCLKKGIYKFYISV